ncbi:hypothetical protein [Kineococcus arenarius]|uniref:hypothetical protein n=1 Tax=Kineococcus sp. SYSU DK007 TaxID=3383128 RepID=UPI003D7C3E35
MVACPTDDVLREIGRVAVAGAEVDHALSRLGSVLDRTAKGTKVRGGKGTRARIRKLACERVTGHLLDQLLQSIDTAEVLARHQHLALHQDWSLISGPPTAQDREPGPQPGAPLHAQQFPPRHGPARAPARPGTWQQAPDDLSRWRPAPAAARSTGRSGDARGTSPRHEQDVLDELQHLHAELTELAEHLDDLGCGIARARDLGDPPEWDGPAPRGRRLTATFTAQRAARYGVEALVLTLPETGQRHSRVPVHQGAEDGDPVTERYRGRSRSRGAEPGWYRLLPWATEPGAEAMSTDVLDRALERAGWNRVMPWLPGKDATSISTTVERIG